MPSNHVEVDVLQRGPSDRQVGYLAAEVGGKLCNKRGGRIGGLASAVPAVGPGHLGDTVAGATHLVGGVDGSERAAEQDADAVSEHLGFLQVVASSR